MTVEAAPYLTVDVGLQNITLTQYPLKGDDERAKSSVHRTYNVPRFLSKLAESEYELTRKRPGEPFVDWAGLTGFAKALEGLRMLCLAAEPTRSNPELTWKNVAIEPTARASLRLKCLSGEGNVAVTKYPAHIGRALWRAVRWDMHQDGSALSPADAAERVRQVVREIQDVEATCWPEPDDALPA